MSKVTFLVTGLESSCTKFVAQMIATSAYITKTTSEWDGHNYIENDHFVVMHRSLPHGERNNFISVEFANCFDKVIISTRDFYASMLSKNRDHQKNSRKARREHRAGTERLRQIYSQLIDKTHIFSYETAYLLGQPYIDTFLESIGFDLAYVTDPFKIRNINQKCMKELL